MKTLAMALAAGLAFPLALPAQDLVEVRFDRVHLRNGNVVDGHIIDRNLTTVTVKVNGGEIFFKFGSIDWIEKVKMKSLRDAAIVVDKPIKEFELGGAKGKLKITDYADLERDVLRLVMGQGLRPLALGLGIGLVGAIGLAQLVSRLLYGIDPTDPMCFAGSLAVLVIVGVAACLFPARRAVALEPVRALRAL